MNWKLWIHSSLVSILTGVLTALAAWQTVPEATGRQLLFIIAVPMISSFLSFLKQSPFPNSPRPQVEDSTLRGEGKGEGGVEALAAIAIAIAFLFVAGCSSISTQTIKLDSENYEANKTLARETLKTWSFNSGFITCAGLTDKMKFPILSASEARALLQNSQIALGIAELDEIAKKRASWSDEDYDYGCSLGIKARVGSLAAIDILKLFPTVSPYLKAVFP